MSLRRFIPRFRFSLRTMMIVVTLVTVLFGVWWKRYEDLRLRHVALETLFKKALFLSPYSFQMRHSVMMSYGTPSKEELEKEQNDLQFRWDHFLYGREYADPVIMLQLANCDPIREDWPEICAAIARQDQLEVLMARFNNGQSTDLAFLHKLKNLNSLHVIEHGDAILDDDFINYIRSDNKLTEVKLDTPRITSQGVENLLARSPNLESLAIPANALNSKLITQLKRNLKLKGIAIGYYSGATVQAEFLKELLADRNWHRLEISSGDTNLWMSESKNSDVKIEMHQMHVEELRTSGISKLSITSNNEIQNVYCYLTNEVQIENCEQLKTVYTNDVKKLSISSLPGLEELESEVDDLTVRNCINLKLLKLYADKSEFENLKSLTKVSVPTNRIPQVIGQCSSLKFKAIPSLAIYESWAIDKQIANELLEMPNISEVEIKKNYRQLKEIFIEEGALGILGNSKSLTTFRTPIDSRLVKDLGPEFKRLKNVKRLELHGFGEWFDSNQPALPFEFPENLETLVLWEVGSTKEPLILNELKKIWPDMKSEVGDSSITIWRNRKP